MSEIGRNLLEVKRRIEIVARTADRDPACVTLVLVSKTQSARAVRQAFEAGQRDFGENYAQELRKKAEDLADLNGIRWHFIGRLQRNKAKYVVPHAAMVHTVDSIPLVQELERQAARLGRSLECLVQVNIGAEDQKSGCEPEDLPEILDAVERTQGLSLRGLMAIPPWDLEVGETRKYFKALAMLREEHGGAVRLAHLSMGMSQDFEAAIEEGATLVRVGTAVFGPRRTSAALSET